MTIELSHIGEVLISELLSRLCTAERLDQVRCKVTGISLASDLDTLSPRFIADQAQLRVQTDDATYACDGAQTVDVLCVGQQRAIAMEAKLGLTRMSPSEFPKRFCDPCSISGHSDPRLNGSMIAVLDRRLPFVNGRVCARIGDQGWLLGPHWWLVVRERVWNSWAVVLPVRLARILVFDELARLYGDGHDFDDLVRHIIGNDFAKRWRVELDL